MALATAGRGSVACGQVSHQDHGALQGICRNGWGGGRWAGALCSGSSVPARQKAACAGPRVARGRLQWASRHTSTGCGSQRGLRTSLPRSPERQPLPSLAFTKQNKTAFQQTEKPHLYSPVHSAPNWQLTHGTMRAAAGRACSASRSIAVGPERERAAQSVPGTAVRGLGAQRVGSAGFRGGRRPCGWSASRTEAQPRSPRRSPGVLPPAPAPPPPSLQPRLLQPAPGGGRARLPLLVLSLARARLAVTALTFPSLDPRCRSPGQVWGRLPTSGGERDGCPVLHPEPSARSGENRTMSRAGDQGKALERWLGFGLLGLFLLPVCLSLEVSVGKATTIYAVNGSAILLPCTFSSCFGFENLYFKWTYNSTDVYRLLIDGIVKNEKSDPKVRMKDDDRITLEGSTKEKMNNISIQLSDLEFSDTGKYTCYVRNPKEKDLDNSATIFLQVVDKLEEVDNTVTLIILAVVGGVIGLLVCILLLKKLITFILKKTREKKKECLVSSSGNDNTENGLPGSKAEEKPPTKV